MATPQSYTSYEASGPKKLEQITFRFCSECSNMLYPKEDEEAHKLQFTCRTCQYTEDAQSTCVFRNELNSSSGETAGVTQDVGSDPTVSSCDAPPVLCLSCAIPIKCVECGSASSDLGLVQVSNELESMGLCQVVMSVLGPLCRFDEESMDDDDDDGTDPSTEDMDDNDSMEGHASGSNSDRNGQYAADGAMIVEI